MIMQQVTCGVATTAQQFDKRAFKVIHTLPEDFLSEADFDFSEEIILELDF